MKQPRTRRMHYLPCVLLSRFGEGVSRDAVVWVWDKVTGKTRQSKVEAVAFENHLYRLPRGAVEALAAEQRLAPRHAGALVWEEIFAAIEGSLGRLLDAISSMTRLPPDDSEEMYELLHAILLIDARTPARMKEIGGLTEFLLNLRAESAEPDDSPHVVVPFDENKHLHLANAMKLLEPYYQAIRAMGWSLRVSLGAEYVICDYPLRWVFARTPDSELSSPAPRVHNSMGMFPLSRTLLLTGESAVPTGVRPVGIEWAAYHNTNAFLEAERFVYSYSATFPIMWPPPVRPAYEAIYDGNQAIGHMTPELLARLAGRGLLPPPSRFEVVTPDPRDRR